MKTASTPTFLRIARKAGLLALAALFTVVSLWAQQSEEAENYYKKWLEEDVKYIITSEEYDAFKKLRTDEERDQFIEQFWLRRDPDPTTSQNEVKEEHYRRIAYANEHFHSGVEGWRTDRGIIYIKFGPPTGIEKMPEGGSYYRKAREGGGLTYTHPFEVWFYNHIEGVGDGIEIEFVDFSRTNEYRMARDANDKDALLYVPGAGLTDAEHFGTQTRFDRLRTRFMGDVDARGAPGAVGFYALRARDMPMQRLQTLYDLQRPAEIQFKDLEKVVRVRVSYADLPFNFRTDHVQISERAWLVPVTVFFKNRDLTFEAVDEGRTKRATVNLYGQVESLGGRIVYVFEEAVKQDVPADQLQQRLEETAVFQKRFPLEPGRYKLTIVAQDLKSSRLSTIEKAIVVEESDQERLSASSLMLTKEVQPLADDLTLSDPFVIGKYKVIPASDNQFSPGEQFVQAYFEVYNMTLDQTTLEPSPKVELALFGPEGQMFDFTPIDQEFEFVGDRLMVYKTLPFAGLEKGNYKVKFRVTDLISGQVIETEARFELTESSNIQARSANP